MECQQVERKHHFEVYCTKENDQRLSEEQTKSRSCVLDHFSRNKGVLKKLKRWLLWCRKCYQTTFYWSNTWPYVKRELILEDLQMFCLDEGCLAEGSHVLKPCSKQCPIGFESHPTRRRETPQCFCRMIVTSSSSVVRRRADVSQQQQRKCLPSLRRWMIETLCACFATF